MINIEEYKEIDFHGLVDCINDFEDYYASLAEPERKSRSPEFGKQFTPVLLKMIEEHTGKIFVAKDNLMIVGFVAGFIEQQSALDTIANGERKSGILKEIFVRESYRDQNIASDLLDKIENYFKEKNCNEIKVEVDDVNKDVESFYQKRGYKEKSTILNKFI